MVMLNSSFSAWIRHFLACMGGCFGSCGKATPIISVDEPSKGLRIQGRIVRKTSMSDDFWSTSTYDMDVSTVQSQRSISSLSMSNQPLNHSSGGSAMSSHSEFVNQGLLLWNENRLQWIGCNKSENRTQQRWKPRFGWDTPYEGLLGTKNPFPRPIPLCEMVDLLVDVWEQEGLYD